MFGDIIGAVLATVIGNYMTSAFVLGLIVAGVQVWRWKGRRTSAVVSGLFLNAYLLYGLGVAYAINFVMHSIFGDYAAKTIGWAQSPFQLELALASLGFAVIAIVIHTRGGQLRAKVAVVIAAVIFGLGAAAGHVYQEIVNHDDAVNNAGFLLFSDIGINLVGLATVIWHAIAIRRQGTLTDARASEPAKPTAG